MKTAALILLCLGLMVAVLDGGLRAWDQEAAAREEMDRCLFAGYSPTDCLEATP